MLTAALGTRAAIEVSGRSGLHYPNTVGFMHRINHGEAKELRPAALRLGVDPTNPLK